MPALNTRHRQPISALWYSSIGALALAVLILLVGTTLATSQTIAEASSVNIGQLFLPITILVAIIPLAYPVLYYFLFTFEFSEKTVTVNSGILFRQYETISFDRIQVVDNERGPLLMLFGLTEMRIWTASPDQYNQEHMGHLDPSSDARILLRKDDAESVKLFVARAHSSSGSGGL